MYEYITRRFLASCSKDAQGMETTVDVDINGEEFSASGQYSLNLHCMPLPQSFS